MIALAIESSNTRGMGHLFRSLIYVKYLRQHNIDFIYLINNDECSLAILQKNGIPFEVVDYCDFESNWEREIVEKYNVTVWINDKFETTLKMAQNIRAAGPFFTLIDDIGEGEVLADIHFVGLIHFTKNKFKSNNIISGMEYVVLDDEINKYKYYRSAINKIIVSFGGSDPHNNTITVVKELMESSYTFDVAVGPNFLYEADLYRMAGNRFQIYKSVPSLIELFSHYDLAITGGGITCCEANAAGLPCIIIANAPHEINTGKKLEKFGGCIYAGSYEKWDRNIIQRIESIDVSVMSQKGMQVFKTDAVHKIFKTIEDILNNKKRI